MVEGSSLRVGRLPLTSRLSRESHSYSVRLTGITSYRPSIKTAAAGTEILSLPGTTVSQYKCCCL